MSIISLKNNFESLVKWKKFNPNDFIDFNPCHIELKNGKSFVFFRREEIPLFKKDSAIYYVEIGDDLQPINTPQLLIKNGEDPRVISIEERIFLFYIVPKKINSGSAIGCAVHMCEIIEDQSILKIIAEFNLPTNPFPSFATQGGIYGWEKNWVPFNNNKVINIIYSLDPWVTFELNFSNNNSQLNINNTVYKYGVKWDFGQIRGGTPPIKYKENFYITFFHSSTILGGKKCYSIGAVLIDVTNGSMNPIYLTKKPLVTAPLHGNINDHGWPTAASVLFPLSARRVDDCFQVMCGVNDFDIGCLNLSYNDIDSQFTPIKNRPNSTIFDIYSEKILERNDRPVLNVPSQVGGVAEASIIKLSSLLFGGGNTFIDIGAHIGFYAVLLNQDFENVIAFEPSRFQNKWLNKNISDNEIENISSFDIGISDHEGEADLYVLSSDGGLNTLDQSVASNSVNIENYKCAIKTLDSFNFKNVDLIKIDVEGLESQVLNGAIDTINSSRPIILIEVWNELDRREKIKKFMLGNNYSFEFLLPSSPELAFCFPNEKRNLYSWFFTKE